MQDAALLLRIERRLLRAEQRHQEPRRRAAAGRRQDGAQAALHGGGIGPERQIQRLAQHAQHRKQGAAGRPRFAFAPGQPAVIGRRAGKFAHQPALADSRLADHQNHAQAAAGRLPGGAQQRQRRLPSQQRKGVDPGRRRADLLGGQAPGPGLTARRGQGMQFEACLQALLQLRADHGDAGRRRQAQAHGLLRHVPGAVLAFAFEHRAALAADGDAHARIGARHALPQRQRRTRRIAGGTLVVLRPAEQGRQAVGAAAGQVAAAGLDDFARQPARLGQSGRERLRVVPVLRPAIQAAVERRHPAPGAGGRSCRRPDRRHFAAPDPLHQRQRLGVDIAAQLAPQFRA